MYRKIKNTVSKWHIFVGPTANQSFDTLNNIDNRIVIHPPVQSGDLIDLQPSKKIGIIICDGVYWTKPALQIPEILFAIYSGSIVVGVSSYGALRYADITENYGMVGYGEISDFYKKNPIGDDADVALVHDNFSPYNTHTIPIINLFFTLKNLPSIQEQRSKKIIDILRKIPILKRTWENFKKALNDDVEMLELLEIMKKNYRDQKNIDFINAISNLDLLEKMHYDNKDVYNKKWQPTTWWERRLMTSKVYNECLEELSKKKCLNDVDINDAKRIALAWWDEARDDDSWIQSFANLSTIPALARKITDLDGCKSMENINIKRRYQSRYIEELTKYIAKIKR